MKGQSPLNVEREIVMDPCWLVADDVDDVSDVVARGGTVFDVVGVSDVSSFNVVGVLPLPQPAATVSKQVTRATPILRIYADHNQALIESYFARDA